MASQGRISDQKTAKQGKRLPMFLNTHWANSIQTEGVPNLYKVSEDLYRSGQPTAEGMRRLNTMGIRTVVNLRSFYSDLTEIGDTGLGYEHIRFKVWHPEEKQIVKFLQIVTDNRRTPVLVHCQHGADRTGTMCAVHRIGVQGWTKEDALKEMTEGGFGFHGIWDNLIQWIDKLDIDKIKKTGIRENTEPVVAPASMYMKLVKRPKKKSRRIFAWD